LVPLALQTVGVSEKADHGAETTPYMKFGDTVRMEARNLDDTPLFGAIDQKVVPASNKPRS